MNDMIGLALAETLAARLCHELVSPVGAIANGAEILEDEPDFAEDAARLIADSARVVTRRLQFYREAYGSRGGGESRARAVTLEFFRDSKIVCHWPEHVAPAISGLGKLASNLLLTASEALPRGGELVLSDEQPIGGVLRVTASGEGAHIDGIVDVLRQKIVSAEQLTPRSVQAIFTRTLAEKMNMTIDAQAWGNGKVGLVLRSAA